MADNLLQVARDIPERYVRELSTEDLNAIADGRDDDVSMSGLQILMKGKEDLGIGELLDIGGAVAGAGTGAAIGSAFGPVGTVVGGVIGGAVGTFAGEVAEDVIADREVQLGFQEGGAAREATIGAVFDTVTLGAGRGIRAYRGYRAANPSLSEMGQEFRPVLDVMDAAPDSPAALAQTQDFLLRSGGPSLSPTATESASMVTQIGRELGEMGIFSAKYYDDDIAKQKDIVLDAFTSFSNQGLARTQEELGKEIITLKSAADKAMHTVYGSQLDTLKNLKSARSWVTVEPIVKNLREFSKKYESTLVVPFEGQVVTSSLDEGAVSLINNLVSELSGSVTGRFAKSRLEDVINLEKRINQEISKMVPGSAYGNGVARGQLQELHNEIRKTTIGMIRKVDPSMAKIYQRMQREYKNGLDFLDERGIENLIKNGVNKEAYQAIGRDLLGKNPEKAKKLMTLAERSIAMKTKTKPKMDVRSEINKFRESIRASYLKESNMVETKTTGRADPIRNIFSEDSGAMTLLRNSDSSKAVFGERWPEFKKLLNHVVSMSKTRNRETFSLALRSAELQGGVAVASALGGFFAGSVGTGLLGAATILTAPILLYKLTSRPSLINKYIALDNQLEKAARTMSPEQIPEILISNVSKLLSELPEEDVLDIRQAVSDPNYNFGQ